MLSLSKVRAGYGETVVLEDVDLELPERGALAVLGRNGVGKTTLLATVMGHTSFHSGRIELNGRPIAHLPVYERSRLGIGYVPQERLIFPSLSVDENLDVARRPGRWTREAVYDLFPRLKERRSAFGNQLSGGEQQMLAIGRALMARPRLLLLDEPSMGLAPIFVEKIFEIIREISDQGTTILLVEQNALMALDTATRGYVLETGRVALADDAKALKQNEQVRKTYLGEE
jgi:branched-chain amino acid transport system ATP-binding protein